MNARSRAELAPTRAATHSQNAAMLESLAKYKAETERPLGNSDAVARLKKLWAGFKVDKEIGNERSAATFYKKAVTLVKGCGYGPADVEGFSKELVKFQRERNFADKAGIFLSALVNQGKPGSYRVWANYLEKTVCWLGYRNRNSLDIMGDAGRHFAIGMKSGTLQLYGDAVDAGNMRGGKVIIHGNVECISGNMAGGSIFVWGRCTGSPGDGTIRFGRGFRGTITIGNS